MSTTHYDHGRHGGRGRHDRDHGDHHGHHHGDRHRGHRGRSVLGELGDALLDFGHDVGARLPRPSRRHAKACAVPKCHCPSPHRGHLHKTLDAPAKTFVAFRVRNRSPKRLTYAITGTPMHSETGEAGGAVSFAPSSITLDPGEVGLVRAAVDAARHVEGRDYASRVELNAEHCETQTLTMMVTVRRPEEDAPVVDLTCCCHPRPRPLRWYHHDYCDPPEKGDEQPYSHAHAAPKS